MHDWTWLTYHYISLLLKLRCFSRSSWLGLFLYGVPVISLFRWILNANVSVVLACAQCGVLPYPHICTITILIEYQIIKFQFFWSAIGAIIWSGWGGCSCVNHHHPHHRIINVWACLYHCWWRCWTLVRHLRLERGAFLFLVGWCLCSHSILILRSDLLSRGAEYGTVSGGIWDLVCRSAVLPFLLLEPFGGLVGRPVSLSTLLSVSRCQT